MNLNLEDTSCTLKRCPIHLKQFSAASDVKQCGFGTAAEELKEYIIDPQGEIGFLIEANMSWTYHHFQNTSSLFSGIWVTQTLWLVSQFLTLGTL